MRSGEPEFDRAVEASVAILRNRARLAQSDEDALLTYKQLSELLAEQDLDVPYHGGPMPYILEEASLREHAADRGLVSALVVQQAPGGKPTTPSGGFYRMARRRPFNRKGDDYEIWLTEVRRLRVENSLHDSIDNVAEADAVDTLVNSANLGAWLIKCNPQVWDLAEFIADGGETITDWSMVPNYRAELVQEGQRVLFWVTGRDGAYPEPGLWGSGEVHGPATYRDNETDDAYYWLDHDQQQRPHYSAPMNVQLFQSPVPRSTLKADPRLAGMEIFRQPQMGNPLFVTKDELAAIDEHLPDQPVRVTVTESGAGFGNPATKAEVEAAAMEAVTADYEARGWAVKDVSKDCLGWDLTCTSPEGTAEKVEVKGVSGLLPVILLTRNEERAARTEDEWRLAVVTKALTDPRIEIVDGKVARSSCQPFMFQVDLRR